MRLHPLLPALVGLAVLPLAAGCDSNETGALAANTFTIKVGDGPEQTRNLAVYGTGTFDGQAFFGLLLGTGGATDTTFTQPVVVFQAVNTELPDEGTYALANAAADPDAEPVGVVGLYIAPGTTTNPFPAFYLSESGTLRVTESGPGEIRGTYTLRARAIDFEAGTATGPQVTLTGAFRARRDDTAFEGGPALRRLPAAAAN